MMEANPNCETCGGSGSVPSEYPSVCRYVPCGDCYGWNPGSWVTSFRPTSPEPAKTPEIKSSTLIRWRKNSLGEFKSWDNDDVPWFAQVTYREGEKGRYWVGTIDFFRENDGMLVSTHSWKHLPSSDAAKAAIETFLSDQAELAAMRSAAKRETQPDCEDRNLR